MNRLNEILFPSDLSAESDRALEHARFLAEAFGARLTLYHVAGVPAHEYGPWAAGREEEVWTRVEEAARRELSRRAAGLRAPFEIVVRHDVPAARVLVDLSILDQIHGTRPDLVVMATHSRQGFTRFFLGSVAEEVIRHAGRPVLGVRAAEHGGALPYRVLLLSTDLSPASRRVFPMAALLARHFVARVVAVHVAVPGGRAEAGGPPGADEVRQHLGPDFDGLEVAVRTEEGGATWRRIVEAAREERADLVALSRQGGDSLGDEILGSTTDRVLRHAPCPVLVA